MALVKDVAATKLNSVFAVALVALFATNVAATAFVAKSEIEAGTSRDEIVSIAMAHRTSPHVLGAYTQLGIQR